MTQPLIYAFEVLVYLFILYAIVKFFSIANGEGKK